LQFKGPRIRSRVKELEDHIRVKLMMFQEVGDSKDMKIMAWSTLKE